jgi:DNA-binding response OmpR family regulator
VDDEPAVAGVLAAFLRRMGFEVTVTHRAPDAEGLLRGQPWDLLVTDLNIGHGEESEGVGLLRVAREVRPEMRTLLVSGSVSADVLQQLAGADRFLAKPVAFSSLAAEVGALFPAD